MRRIYLIGSLALGLFGLQQTSKAQVVTQTLSFTGSVQTLTVPACVAQISFTAFGAQGANGANTATGAIGGTAGLGARTIGNFTLSGSNVINVYVGGAGTGSVGGFNGGGNGAANTNAGAGGGASDVRLNGTALANRIIVAGGGGGGGNGGCTSSTLTGGNGGAGGGLSGTAGLNSQAGGGGQPGVGTTGGVGGIGCSCCLGATGGAGTSGVGGNGGLGPNVCAAYVSGGAGGGGFNGGAGGGGGSAGTTSCSLNDQGAGGGGAGGTNYFAAGFTGTSVVNGTRTGNGMVIISYSIGATPTVVATSTTACLGKTVTLTASGATTYTWSNGPTTANNAVSPTSNTSYTVIGTGSAPGCTAQAVSNVTVNPTPTIGAVASSPSVCSGATIILTGTGGNTYTWTAPNAPVPSNGVAFSPSTTATPSGNVVYTVTGTSALGCTNVATSTVAVVVTPSLAPTTSTAQICVGGGTITVTATGASTYSWSPGNITTNTMAVSPSTTTTYTLVRTNGACSFTSNVTLTVNPNPGLIIVSNQPSVCSTKPATLTAGGASTYSWTSGGPTFTGSPVVVTPTAIGSPSNITYTVIGNNGTCTSVATYTMPVYPNPTVSIATATAALCLNNSVTLTANSNTNSPAVSYSWSTVAPPTSYTTQAVTLTPTATGAHTVVITNTFGCTSSSVQVIVVHPLPAVTASVVQNKNLVCSGGTTTVSAGGANTYTWTGGPSTATSLVSPLATTVYTVTGKTTTTGCLNTKTVQVNVFIPIISITGPSATCYGGQISLNANGGTTYTWNPGGSIFPSINLTPTTSIVVFLTGRTTSLGVSCASTVSTQITIYANPTITAVANPSAICAGEVAALSSTGASTYLWSDNQTGSPVNVSPTAQSNYTVIGTDGNGCKDTISVLVKVSPCVGINEMTGKNKVISIAPNPNSGEFTIDSDADAVLTLVNALGQTVRTIKVINSTNNKVSVTDLPGGIYYIVGEKDGVKINQKIVIQK
ncbi:MAG: T9SS type A sorting domain-containing protein [Bacteroidia bacterium]|nr:T9SS type A sorting domain-containing protein [Bacteroidia bacterium]